MDRKVGMSASRVILQFSGVSVRRRNYSDISLCKQENKKEERSPSLQHGCILTAERLHLEDPVMGHMSSSSPSHFMSFWIPFLDLRPCHIHGSFF